MRRIRQYRAAAIRLARNGKLWLMSLIESAKLAIVHQSTRPMAKRVGERLVERRRYVFGIPVKKECVKRDKFKIALLVDEYFGGWETPIGGYGAIARNYFCKYIPGERFQVDVILGPAHCTKTQLRIIDGVRLCRLPRSRHLRQRWLDEEGYDLFVSIEMTSPSFAVIGNYRCDTPLLYWVQDPRDLEQYQPRLATVSRLKDDDWSYLQDVARWMKSIMRRDRLRFISQGESLSDIARRLYKIPTGIPIQELVNPIDFDPRYRLNEPPKENKIIFLGRIAAQKRVWSFCEIAKALPQYEFYVLGETHPLRSEAANALSLEAYRNLDGSSKVKNLHFVGHVDGTAKANHIKTAKLLLNTSIWEGIPVSWLEALSFGTLIVSSFDRDNITSRFGTYIGEVLGDGVTHADTGRFAVAIEHWMTHDEERERVAQAAIEFVRTRHSVSAFVRDMRNTILDATH
jgi:glycosyltransferase involved in cell wall biosynthesis